MTAVVLALLVGLYFLISGLQHKSATIHCQKIAQTPPPKQDFVGRGRSFYSFIYGNTAQFPPSGLSTAPAAAAPCSPYRHLELCGIALSLFYHHRIMVFCCCQTVESNKKIECEEFES